LTILRLSSGDCSLWLFDNFVAVFSFSTAQRKEYDLLDSLDWSRKFDIISISRLSLNASGIPVELVKSLTDEDMQAIADEIAHLVIQEPVEKIAEFVARLYLAEKGAYEAL
jgi:hypothetical protein